MEGSCESKILLSMPSLLASSTDSTAAAAELEGGRLIVGGDDEKIFKGVGFNDGV